MRQNGRLPDPELFASGGCLMSTRILVPLDGAARTEAGPDPSTVSSLVDGLEAKAPLYPWASQRIRRDGPETFSWIHEHSLAAILLAIAGAMEITTFRIHLPRPAPHAG